MPNGRENGGVISEWLNRAGPVLELLNKIGFTSFLLLMIGLGILWASGVIPLKPFDDLSAEHDALHDGQGEILAAVREEVAVLKQVLVVALRTDRRNRIIDCVKITDKELRDLCLYVDEEKLKP